MTKNHNYNTPEKGSADWHVPLNENFAKLDTDIEVRDVESNRNEYTPKDGAKFFATDTGTVYIGDGDQWQRVHQESSGGGSAAIGTPFGASIVDPNASDFGPALQDAVANSSTGTVVIPPTTWDASSTAVLDEPVTLHVLGGTPFPGESTGPQVTKQADIPIIEANQPFNTTGGILHLSSDVDDSTAGIISHNRPDITVTGDNIGGPVVHLLQAAADHNLNQGRVNASGTNGGSDVIRVENSTGDAPNVNALRLDVHTSFENSGWAINQVHGFGSRLTVQLAEGSHTGAIKCLTNNQVRLDYAEGPPVGVQFEGAGNYAFIGYFYAVENAVIDNHGNNTWQYQYPDEPDLAKSYQPWIFDHDGSRHTVP